MRHTHIKSLSPLLAATLIGSGLISCGDNSKRFHEASSKSSASVGQSVSRSAANGRASTRSAAETAATTTRPNLAAYGHEASAADKQAIAALVTRYYADVVADDGAAACTLIYSIFAEAIPEDYGQGPPGSPVPTGTTCAAVMSKLFKQASGRSSAILATTRVTNIRTKGKRGTAFLSSKAMPNGEIQLQREHSTWKVQSLIGIPLEGSSSTPVVLAESVNSSAGANSTEHPYAFKDLRDSDDDPGSYDDEPIVDFGHSASSADRRLIAALVKRYYSAAAARDGTRACSELYSLVAEDVPEEFSEIHGKTCGEVMTKVFARHRSQLSVDLANLKVTRVRVEGEKGLAMVYFGKKPEPYVLVHRDGAKWKIKSLLEIGLP